jgi:hypothetical protein
MWPARPGKLASKTPTFWVKVVGKLSMQHVNLQSHLAVWGSDERPKAGGDARRCV